MSAGPYCPGCGQPQLIAARHSKNCPGPTPKEETHLELRFYLRNGAFEIRTVPAELLEVKGFDLCWTDRAVPGDGDLPYYRETEVSV